MDTETESLRTQVKGLTEGRQRGRLGSEKTSKQLLLISTLSYMLQSPRERAPWQKDCSQITSEGSCPLQGL